MLRTFCFKSLNQFNCVQKYSYSQFSKIDKKKFLILKQNVKCFGRSSRAPRINPNRPIFENVTIETGPIPSQNIAKAVLFSMAFSAGTFIGVSIWEYEKLRSKYLEKKAGGSFAWFTSDKKVKKKPEWQVQFNKWWSRLTPGEQVFVPIFVLNSIVFGLWRIPRLQPFMIKYFCSNPAAKNVCWPMLFSTFSHVSLFHIFANMFVLHSFANAAVASLGKEQFLGLYLTSGVLSSLSSYIYKAATFQSGISLGASGAIMSIFTYVCVAYPDTQLSILFFPIFTFSAGTAVKAVMGLDFVGCLLKWTIFDHAAHLGGALLGIFWYFNGRETLWPLRHHFQRKWDEIRTSVSKK